MSMTGDKEIDRKLVDLEAKLARKYIRQALRKSLKPLLALVKELAPEDTGKLREAIRIVPGRRKRNFISMNVLVDSRLLTDKPKPTEGAGPTDKPPSANLYYAGFLEFGTARMEPRPFLRPALEQLAEQMKAIVLNELRQALSIEMKGAA
jgi:HK97 gp10 family phage protein